MLYMFVSAAPAIAQNQLRDIEANLQVVPILAIVNIHEQKMLVYVGGVLKYEWATSTASSKNTDCTKGVCETPIGTFGVTRQNRQAYSKKWDSPMPNATYFDNDGDAVHAATQSEIAELGHPASHGCVRLHPANAQIFFDLVRHNQRGAHTYPGVTIRIITGSSAPPILAPREKPKPTPKGIIAI